MIDHADVYKGDEMVGTLTRHPDRVEFSYLPGYAGEPVASTLPVSEAPVLAPAGQLPPFFVGLLPEGRRLSALIRVLKVSADDELSLLLAVGGDTVGDVRVLQAGGHLLPVEPVVDLDDTATLDFEELFERSVGDSYDRVAIPGAQPKISGRMISFPVSGTVGPLIVKLDPPEYRDLTANEATMLGVAEAAGGFTVPARMLLTDATGRSGLVVARFDRATGDGVVRRFPVEDGCQALGRYPADKYNLDTAEVITGLAARCTAPAVARLKLTERFLLSYLAGDGDLHARNMAVWKTPSGLWESTPVYDLVCTAIYGDMTLAAPLDGTSSVREIGRRRFLGICDSMGIPVRAAERMLDRRVPAIAGNVAVALEGSPFDGFASVEKVRRMLRRRAELLVG